MCSQGQLCMVVMMGRNPAATRCPTPSMARSKVPSPRMGSLISAEGPSMLTRSSSGYRLCSWIRRSSSTLRRGKSVALVSTVAGPRSSASSRIPSISLFMNGSPPVK